VSLPLSSSAAAATNAAASSAASSAAATEERGRFDHIDVVHGNSDGFIDLSEFLAHFEEVAVSTGHGGPGQPTYLKTWKLTFTMMDDDNDGKLNRDEFHWHDSPWKKDEL
jgi:hypothetical protein